MQNQTIIIFLLLASISGCYGLPTMTKYYEQRGYLQAYPNETSEFDYLVIAIEYAPNTISEYDTKTRKGREQVVYNLLIDECVNATIVKEIREKHPEWGANPNMGIGPDDWWIMQVKCITEKIIEPNKSVVQGIS